MKGSRAWCGGTRQQALLQPPCPFLSQSSIDWPVETQPEDAHASVVPDEEASSYLLLTSVSASAEGPASLTKTTMAVASGLYHTLLASPRLIRTPVKAMSVVAPPPSYDFSETKTPADFVRFHPSVPLPLPTIRHVGLLACQLDPLLRTLQTKVLSAAPSAPPPVPAPAKGAKVKRKTATDVPELKVEAEKGKIFEIELEDTALFPEGGGQNSDSGTMEVAGQKLKVLHVLRKGLKAVHYVVVPEEVEPKLTAGADVVVEVDWERRMDLVRLASTMACLAAVTD